VSYLFGIIVVVLFFVILHYFTELTHKEKAGVSLVLLLFIAGAIYYNNAQNRYREHINTITLKFTQKKKILCRGVEVNQSNFTTSIGTYTFIGKEGTKHASEMFSFDQCQ
jgi:hypothetical protein